MSAGGPAGGRRSARLAAPDPYALKRRRMVEEMVAARAVSDSRVIEALQAVPRHLFVDEGLWAKAYGDHALPIGNGQTISNPSTVARMTELLGVDPEHRVLELGTGSGYQTAVLSRLARHVYSVERLRPLAEQARRNLRRVGAVNVSLKIDDGTLGWEDRGPFDRIIVTAASPELPEALVAQVGKEGKLLIPVGGEHKQRLLSIQRTREGTLVEKDEGSYSFVKLVGKHGWRG